MSKASEYAAACKRGEFGKRLKFIREDGRAIAVVSLEGELAPINTYTSAAEALRLAAWIQDTFGEPGGICKVNGRAHRLHSRCDTTGTGTYRHCLDCGEPVRVTRGEPEGEGGGGE